MVTTNPAVTVRGLSKGYSGTRAVDGIDLDIEQGEVFALLGPNGAGKTTTVEILEGYRKRDAGEVTVLGQDPGRPGQDWRSRIGIVLQNTGGHDDLTVHEVVHHFSGYYPNAREPEDVIAAVGLDDKHKTRVRHLSGGQRRRLDVALGILGRPELLFLDEPTTGFDPEARREFWGLVSSLADDGTTILLTTHYLDEAEHLAGRVGIIAGGRIVALDTPAELGGRADEQATVRWMTPDGPREEASAEPTQLITELSSRFGGEVPGLTVSRPTLEDVYLRLIGESADASRPSENLEHA
ncbi:ABC transporter ATP-binding protein [Phytoactinopolyspora mesophila]|uniref:ATP-binding cassette domain-containing protein n=1 Tax=Phytoactinopolyspora mesophila TaxID=2650750 RepID=A0A7K3MB58_9ACTN|nr:ABC transporter ATP-binding protein [Phytoactinopolyspora mesophila]NDL59638.1 ATP-binding cassette domain-containing protein [Phytoactinopolyspora mesophila]